MRKVNQLEMSERPYLSGENGFWENAKKNFIKNKPLAKGLQGGGQLERSIDLLMIAPAAAIPSTMPRQLPRQAFDLTMTLQVQRVFLARQPELVSWV